MGHVWYAGAPSDQRQTLYSKFWVSSRHCLPSNAQVNKSYTIKIAAIIAEQTDRNKRNAGGGVADSVIEQQMSSDSIT